SAEIPTVRRNCTGERKTSEFIARVLSPRREFCKLAEMSLTRDESLAASHVSKRRDVGHPRADVEG
ncbi:MAG: hypothetical protein WBP52_07010, partial [Terriglobales bacterium]